ATPAAPPAAAPAKPAASPVADIPAPTMSGSLLDRAAARRAWPAVIAEIRRIKPTRAELYGRIEASVDSDGHTLVLEFPADQEFAMQMAEDPDMRELLQRALGAVMGFAPPVRFQLSRARLGAPVPSEEESTPPIPPLADAQDDIAPSDDGAHSESYQTTSAPHPWVADAAPDDIVAQPDATAPGSAAPASESASAGDLARQLMESLGAEIVEERPAESAAVGGSTAGDESGPDLLELESSDFGLKDPELFDSDDGEDD
ncbi:MAG: hypothetical protein WCJ13_11060, partial [Coriobacteriia bacterium]